MQDLRVSLWGGSDENGLSESNFVTYVFTKKTTDSNKQLVSSRFLL